MSNSDCWLTVAVAAAYLDVTEGHIQVLCRKGKLPAMKSAHSWRIRIEDATAYRDARQPTIPDVTPEQVKTAYIEAGSIRAAAKALGMSAETTKRLLIEANVDLSGRAAATLRWRRTHNKGRTVTWEDIVFDDPCPYPCPFLDGDGPDCLDAGCFAFEKGERG